MKANTTPERPIEQQACLAFVGLSVTIGVIGFWSKGYLPGALLTVAMAVIVYLLSRAVERVAEAWSVQNYFTAVVAGILAVGFGAIEADLNHIGLDHLNGLYDLAPVEYVWPACGFISAVNVFASFAFARVLTDKADQKPAVTTGSLDNSVFGNPPPISKPTSVVPLFTPAPVDPKTAAILDSINRKFPKKLRR